MKHFFFSYKSLFLFLSFAFVLVDARPSHGQTQPNIILINLDDADSELFELPYSHVLFPTIMGVAENGIYFRNFHVTTPLCGPSRACLYRGQYAHNTGFRVNEPLNERAHGMNGGFKFYREQGYFEDDLSVWMQNAGYRTMLVGKFLHHDFEPIIPPGWDDFHSYLGAKYYDTLKFTNQDVANGSFDRIPEGEYRTVSETKDAIELIEEHHARDNDQPFFLNVNTIGPHSADPRFPEMIDRAKSDWWPTIKPRFTLSYNEEDISDKRGFFEILPKLPDWAADYLQVYYRDRIIATRSIDDFVKAIQQKLDDLELTENTYIMITSDNGYLMGQHRSIGKGTPVDRSTRVPLFVIGPNVPAGVEADQLIGHIDLAPTIVAMAKGTTPDFVDGKSFATLLTQEGLDRFPNFRQALLIENWFSINNFGTVSDTASTSLRLVDSVYTEWANGDKDFFDLVSDHQQLDNAYDDLNPILQDFYGVWLRTLKNSEAEPFARFSNPNATQKVVAKGSHFRGLAEDPTKITAVRVAVCDVSSSCYWNGDSWQENFVNVETQLENPLGQITFWNFDAVPTEAKTPGGQIALWAWAYGDNNSSQASATLALIRYDNQPPEVVLNVPESGQNFTGPAMFEGSSFDDVAVAEIQVCVQDTATNSYWNGDSFSSEKVFLSVVPSSNGDWGLMTSLPIGDYEATLSSTDTSGNDSEESDSVSFSVN